MSTTLLSAGAILLLAFGLRTFLKPLLNPSFAQYAALYLAIGSRVSRPGSKSYNRSLNSYWTLQASSLAPDCIISPQTTSEVSTIFRILGAFNLVGFKCKAAIRGGGHTPFAGSSNVAKGITIDLCNLNTLSLNEDRTILSVGGGAKWGDVYRFLEPYQLTVVGGRVSSVGVGGLLTGGGISFFSPLRGFACDNVVSFEVVLAGGKVITASATKNPDLFLALKGGSNNFGVVTRFNLTTYPNIEIWGGMVNYDIITARQQIAGFSELNSSTDFDPHAAIMMVFAYAKGFYVVSNTMQYTLPTPNPTVFRKLTTLQPQYSSTLRVANQSSFADEQVEQASHRTRQIYVTTTFQNDLKLLNDVYDMWHTSTQDLVDVPGIIYAYLIQPIPPNTIKASAQRGGNVLGLKEDDGALVLALMSVSWDNEKDDALVERTTRDFLESVGKVAKDRGLASNFKYLNYAAQWQDPITGYGTKNKEILQRTSKKYDPAGVFQNMVPGGFKLFR